jgi:hypothetical protein
MKNITIIGLFLLLLLFVTACAKVQTPDDTSTGDNTGGDVNTVDTTPPETPNRLTQAEEAVNFAVRAGYVGEALAGEKSLYLKFNQADYDKALAEGKLILLNFYAGWDSTCAGEDAAARAAFIEINDARVVGFRVNYEEAVVSDDEKAIALKFSVASHHTKVIVKGGKNVFKTPDNWDKNTYINELKRNIG